MKIDQIRPEKEALKWHPASQTSGVTCPIHLSQAADPRLLNQLALKSSRRTLLCNLLQTLTKSTLYLSNLTSIRIQIKQLWKRYTNQEVVMKKALQIWIASCMIPVTTDLYLYFASCHCTIRLIYIGGGLILQVSSSQTQKLHNSIVLYLFIIFTYVRERLV